MLDMSHTQTYNNKAPLCFLWLRIYFLVNLILFLFFIWWNPNRPDFFLQWNIQKKKYLLENSLAWENDNFIEIYAFPSRCIFLFGGFVQLHAWFWGWLSSAHFISFCASGNLHLLLKNQKGTHILICNICTLHMLGAQSSHSLLSVDVCVEQNQNLCTFMSKHTADGFV